MAGRGETSRWLLRLRLAGALIEGSVDVHGGIINCPVEMTDCCFTGALVLAKARIEPLTCPGRFSAP